MFRALIALLFQKEYCISVTSLLFSSMLCKLSILCNLRENWQEIQLFAVEKHDRIPSNSTNLLNILNILAFYGFKCQHNLTKLMGMYVTPITLLELLKIPASIVEI